MKRLSLKQQVESQSQVGNAVVLNAFKLTGVQTLCWPCAVYKITPLEGPALEDSERGLIKQIMWRVRESPEYIDLPKGFVVARDSQHVLVPVTWRLADHNEFEGFRVRRTGEMTLRASDPDHTLEVRELLRNAARTALMRQPQQFGALWSDRGGLCEVPQGTPENGIHHVRRYEVLPDLLHDHTWVLKLDLRTVSIDARAIDSYYRSGEVVLLAEHILAKRINRQTRRGTPTAVRMLHRPAKDYPGALELSEPELLLEHAALSPSDQRTLEESLVLCQAYRTGQVQCAPQFLHLILDTQITGTAHSETLLDPANRARAFRKLLEALDGMDAYGCTVAMERHLVKLAPERVHHLSLPELSLRDGVLAAPTTGSIESIRLRAKERSRRVRHSGYLYRRPIDPLLAVPAHWSNAQAQRLLNDLETLARDQNTELRFGGPLRYKQVEDIAHFLETSHHDSVLVVLPEGSRTPERPNDTHEQVKKQLQVTSQCIQQDHTLHRHWLKLPWDRIDARDRRQVQANYQAVLLNSLVKHGWVPFAANEAAHFNVHLGIDVGGVRNNKVMTCLGIGFEEKKVILLPHEIVLNSAQAEPIPDDQLYLGLLDLFSQVHAPYRESGKTPNFERVLFFRDGDLNGHGEEWQEIDAFPRLLVTLQERGWVSQEATWCVVEISKRAQAWRQLRQQDAQVLNPLVGTVSFPFDDPHVALVSTTGDPYLSQGTAAPIVVRMHSLCGELKPLEVLRDLLWEADMCFTKPDQGYRLPFTLHVADQGALQLARTYQVSGVTL